MIRSITIPEVIELFELQENKRQEYYYFFVRIQLVLAYLQRFRNICYNLLFVQVEKLVVCVMGCFILHWWPTFLFEFRTFFLIIGVVRFLITNCCLLLKDLTPGASRQFCVQLCFRSFFLEDVNGLQFARLGEALWS